MSIGAYNSGKNITVWKKKFGKAKAWTRIAAVIMERDEVQAVVIQQEAEDQGRKVQPERLATSLSKLENEK